MELTLAELLLRRKELQEKVDQLRQINQRDLFITQVIPQNVRTQTETEIVRNLTIKMPFVSMQQVTHAYDAAARNLRLVDAAIQKANWNTIVQIDESAMVEYVDPYAEEFAKEKARLMEGGK